jgi:hypothetical protein
MVEHDLPIVQHTPRTAGKTGKWGGFRRRRLERQLLEKRSRSYTSYQKI